MKYTRLFILALLVTGLYSCSKEDPIEKNLRESFGEIAKQKDLVYRYRGYSINDTLTVKSILDSLKRSVEHLTLEMDKDRFLDYRNQEFKEFKNQDEKFEEKLMNGDLDNSPWFSVLHRMIEKADSVLDVWESIDKYNGDYIKTSLFFLCRRAQYCGVEGAEQLLYSFEENKGKLDTINAWNRRDGNEIVEYIVTHNYSIYSEYYNKDIEFEKIVHLAPDFSVIKVE